jgi:hypothetical protein
MLVALALLQIAVVSTELSHSGVKTATAANGEYDARHALASIETERKASAF